MTRLATPAAHTWPALWVASEEREVLHIHPAGSHPRSALVPKGLVHAVDRNSPALALATCCGKPLDHLVLFPQYDFAGSGTRSSRLVTLCSACDRSSAK